MPFMLRLQCVTRTSEPDVAGNLRGIVADRESARKSSWARMTAIQLLILIATLGAAEVVLRVIDLRYLRAHRVGADRIYNYDAELGWFPVPNSDGSFTGMRTIRVRHNSLGLRDVEPDAAPKPTIAFFGDSFVWGYDAEQNERFTEILRAKMPEQRIVNAGVTAYGTDQEYLLLRRARDPNPPQPGGARGAPPQGRPATTRHTPHPGPPTAAPPPSHRAVQRQPPPSLRRPPF